MIATFSLRILQILFSVIALGLSISLINGQLAGTGGAPSQIDFTAFCGGWGLLVALVGCAALFVEAIQGMVMVVLDAAAMLVSLIGGIVFAATLTAHGCWNDISKGDGYLFFNVVTRGAGTDPTTGKPVVNLDANPFARCQEAQAVTAFLWFAFACFAATSALAVTGRGGKGGSIV